MSKSKNGGVVLCGVGGQGILLASEVLGQAALLAGYDVKGNEIHGMAQRGGSVSAQVRWGEKIWSPLLMSQSADVILALETGEALRYSNLLKSQGQVLAARLRIQPAGAGTTGNVYPPLSELEQRVKTAFAQTLLIDADSMAQSLGNIKVSNIIMLGVLAESIKNLPANIPDNCWLEAIKTAVKPQFIELNLQAFQLGRNSV